MEAAASVPVPKNGGRKVPLNADLMFLEAYQAEEHTLYFGQDSNNLKAIASVSGTETNIVRPPKLKKNVTYYWQVGARKKTGIEDRSPVWTFTTTE